MADVDLQVADAPLAETDELDESEAEELEDNEPGPSRRTFAKVASPAVIKPRLTVEMDEEDDDEWNAFHSHEPLGISDEAEGSRGEMLNGTGGCAESVLGSVSSGYSSLAGTCDNLMQHARGGMGSSSVAGKFDSLKMKSSIFYDGNQI